MARSRRRRSSARRSRRRGGGGVSRSRRGFVPSGTPALVAGTAGGFIAANMLLDRVPGLPASLKVGNGRIAAKAGLSIALGMLASKFASKPLGTAILVGGLTSAALDVFGKVATGTGVKGWPTDALGAEGYPSLESGVGEDSSALAGEEDALNGVGEDVVVG
jgi:hypothetical protein